MRKVAYTLTNKRNNLRQGQRVALVFPNAESVPFACVFHGCLLAGLVPVVVEVPQSSEVCSALIDLTMYYCITIHDLCFDNHFFKQSNLTGGCLPAT